MSTVASGGGSAKSYAVVAVLGAVILATTGANVRPSRITAVSPSSGAVLAEARTEARVYAVGPDGLIAVDGRDMAYLPFR